MLSDYVLALLKHDASEGDIEKMLAEQLDDFLGESEWMCRQASCDNVELTTGCMQRHRELCQEGAGRSEKQHLSSRIQETCRECCSVEEEKCRG